MSELEEQEGLSVAPDRGKVNGTDTLELEVSVQVEKAGPFSGHILVDMRGGKSIKLPVKALASVPQIEVAEDEFDFGSVFLGGAVKLPITLSNKAAVGGSLRIDLGEHPEFSLELPRDNWSPQVQPVAPQL